MTQKELRRLFELCDKLYEEEYKKSGMITPIPYATAQYGGNLIVYSAWSIHSEKMKKVLKKEFRD